MESLKQVEASLIESPAKESPAGDSEGGRRKNPRYNFMRRADWDFFTAATGSKAGYLENISEKGCLLRTTEPIDHRRWLRLVVKEPKSNFFFTAVGRVVRREDRMESWHSDASEGESTDSQDPSKDWTVTLHRYGIEFVHGLNPVVLESIQQGSTRCAKCGTSPASIADIQSGNAFYCVLCHLRDACQNLLSTDPATVSPDARDNAGPNEDPARRHA